MDVNSKVQGVGLGPWREREREEAGLFFLPVVRAFCSNVHLMMRNPRCREVMCLWL